MTTGLPAFSAASSSERAGSMPPITSTTMSTSAGSTSADASAVSSAGSIPAAAPVPDPAHRDAGQLEPGADPRGQVVGLLGEQPGHLGADDAAAEQAPP